ncbi:MAG: hypothetical protein CM15mP121_2100 [Bacteroidota bacterium]|nr:MAG: hypothetical protein CM15mP121_2100 [Bacteroidota bacterium]
MQTYANGQTVPYNTIDGGDLMGLISRQSVLVLATISLLLRDVPAMEIYMDISNLYDLVFDGEGFPTAQRK